MPLFHRPESAAAVAALVRCPHVAHGPLVEVAAGKVSGCPRRPACEGGCKLECLTPQQAVPGALFVAAGFVATTQLLIELLQAGISAPGGELCQQVHRN